MKFSKDVLTAYLGDVDEFNNTFVENLKETQEHTVNPNISIVDIMKVKEFGCSIKNISDIFKDVTSEGLGCCKEVTVPEEDSDKRLLPTVKGRISTYPYQCIICKGLFYPHETCIKSYMTKWTGRNDQWVCNKHYIKCSHSNKVHEEEVVYMRVYNGKSIMN